MSVSHNSGRAKRAQALVSQAIYFVFSSDTSTEAAGLDLSVSGLQTAMLGARQASRQLLVRAPIGGETANITINGTGYISVDPSNLATLASQGVNLVYLECILNDSVVADAAVVNSVYVFSDVQGVVPAGKNILTHADLINPSTVYTIESVTKLGSGITMDGTVNKVLQMLLPL